MLAIIKYALLTAIRDKLFQGLIAALLIAVGVASFTGGIPIIENKEMSLTIAASSIRIILVAGLIVFISFYVRRLFETREIEVIVTKPISRPKIITSYFCAFSIVGIIISLFSITILAVLRPETHLLLFWGVSLIAEILMVVAFTLAFAFFTNSAFIAVISSFGFYIVTRLIGFFVTFITPTYTHFQYSLRNIFEKILYYISAVFPRMDLYAHSEWLVRGITDFTKYFIPLAQTTIYIPFILLICIYEFRKREF